MKVENVDKYLRENGISPSYQRKRILEYLYETDTHPNVNDIYEVLIKEIPSLSKTTVYNTLNLLIEKKIVEPITIEGTETRYDVFNPVNHAHFKCLECQKVYDIHLSKEATELADLQGFEVTEQHYHFKGICKTCKQKN